jgi:poly(3-hydroxybutyrate) depolymerase
MSRLFLSLRACLLGVGLSAAVMACAPIQAQPVGQAAAPPPAPEASAPVSAKQLRARGVQRFIFSGWAGPALPIWYFRPAGVAADAPLLFVFHGVRRDADRYIGEWLDVAAREKVIVVVPEFGSEAFPGARGYNHGNLFDAKGAANPTAQRSFSLIEPLFDDLRAREGLTREQYWMFGHSAGAQFVHRFVMTGHARRMERAVSANAGSYMMPDARVNWPFGLGTLPGGLWSPSAAYGTRMTVLLGTADNDPDYPSLPRDPEAMAQGPHRLARGQNFFAAARADAARTSANFAWTCALAPGVGHENGKMAPFGIAVLKQKTGIKPCP